MILEKMTGQIVKQITGAKEGSDSILFEMESGDTFQFYHEQDCCESVDLESIEGDVENLIGSPLTQAEESTNQEENKYGDSKTWTFYKFATVKGYVTFRWLGESNGYYSENVDLKINGKWVFN